MSKEKEMTFWEHIAELRARLKRILISIFVMTFIMMLFPADPISIILNPLQFIEVYEPISARILHMIQAYILPEGAKLIAGQLETPFELWLISSILLGVIFSMPVIGYEIYAFVDPALYPHERAAFYPFMVAFLSLFFVGVLFAFFFVLPALMKFLIMFSYMFGIEPVVTAMSFFTMVFFTALATGGIFTFPAVLVLLIKFGIVGTKFFKRNRRFIYIGLFILVAFITPDGGVAGNIILFTPLALMFEIALFIGSRYEKKRLRELHGEIKCKYCESKMDINDIFCPKCGRSNK